MLKKLPLTFGVVMFGLASYAQTIVPTTPQNKKAILEEFTGIYCQFCPDGHARAQAIKDANPDDFFVINIHQGGFANGTPDFRTPYGDAIVNQSYSGGGFGYPSGTINRHVFPGRSMASGGGTAMDRGQWAVSANETMQQTSPVNLAVEASIDVSTRILTVHVEAYYTSNSPESTNKLNVALLQNNTKGPQTGGNMGNNYNHMHRLVELITGQWGETISTTTAGTFVDRTFTYTIPAGYNNVPAELADMEIVAFISNTTQEIPTGNGTFPTFTGFEHDNDAAVKEILPIDPTCAGAVGPTVVIENLGNDTLTALAIGYTINGSAHTYNWTGSIKSLRKETIEFPAGSYTVQATNSLVVKLPNDGNNSNNEKSITFDKAPEGTGSVEMTLKTDRYGRQCTWDLKNSAGDIVYSGGPYDNGSTHTVIESFVLEDIDCYTFTVRDSANNGGTSVTLKDSHGQIVFYTNSSWKSSVSSEFSSNGVLGVENNSFENISIYPNPATSVISLKNAGNSDIQVYDILGKLIFSQNDISMDHEINVSNFGTGTYFIKIAKDNNVTTKRLVVSN